MEKLPAEIRAVFSYLARAFEPFGKREAESIARALLEDGLGLPNARSPLLFPFAFWPRLLRMQEEILVGRPVAYVCGKTWFYGLPILCDERALIPRPETEELVHRILEDLPEEAFPTLRVLDIGTGTGCISLALKHRRPAWEITGLELREEALALARQNAKALKLEVNFVQGDILQMEQAPSIEGFDLVVSNPPYVVPSEANLMDASVRRYEPSPALYAPEEDPLLFYKYILTFCENGGLKKGGRLYLEINEYRHREVRALFNPRFWKAVRTGKDMQGKWRWAFGSRQ